MSNKLNMSLNENICKNEDIDIFSLGMIRKLKKKSQMLTVFESWKSDFFDHENIPPTINIRSGQAQSTTSTHHLPHQHTHPDIQHPFHPARIPNNHAPPCPDNPLPLPPPRKHKFARLGARGGLYRIYNIAHGSNPCPSFCRCSWRCVVCL